MNHDIAYIAQSLGLKKMGGEYKGPCPICGGNDRFHLKRGKKHDFILHCRYMCPYSALMRELEDRGLVERDKFEPQGLSAEQRRQVALDKVLLNIFEADQAKGHKPSLTDWRRYKLARARVEGQEPKKEYHF